MKQALNGLSHDPIPATPRLGEAVYARARQMILEGRLPPRSLVRESELARQFGVSRTPLREALRQLQAEGLLTPAQHGGYVVIDLGPEQLANAYAVRRVLDGLAAELAAVKRGRVDLAVLADLLEEMDVAVDREDDQELARLNRQFHEAIATASSNDLLQGHLSGIRDLFDLFRSEAVRNPARRAGAHAEHHALYQALVDQDADRAAHLGRQHVAQALSFRLRRAETNEMESPL